MYEVTINTHFSAAHRLRNYNGECERLHGHNWNVTVSIASDKLNELGMVMDFKVLKSKTKALMDEFDHQYLNEVSPFTEINPTTENIAKYIFNRLSETLNTDQDFEKSLSKNRDIGNLPGSIKVSKVTVWESPTCYASYSQ